MNRKDFLIGCGAGLSLLATGPLRVFSAPFLPSEQDHILVLVFLRGGCDGLNLVGPSSDQVYQDARPAHLKVREKGERAGLRLQNGLGEVGFRLHPAAKELKELYDQGDLAILHACGLQNGTRSHFVAMDLIERGLQQRSGSAQGWMARYFAAVAAGGQLPAISGSGSLPVAMRGYGKAVSLSSPQDFNLMEVIRYPDLLRDWYRGAGAVDQAAQTTLDAIGLIQQEVQGGSRLDGGVGYPEEGLGNELSQSLRTLASMIKLDLGLRIGQVDFGGWDTHEHQHYVFPELVRALSQSLAAFYEDLSEYHERLTVLVMSEFGRRLRANKSEGTDHGYGNMMMVLGGQVQGGRMYGQWPGLRTESLDKGVDLAITTDYRSVLGEILRERMDLGDVSAVFPNFNGYRRLGFLG
ncbi:MAG: DUF1501 domain-containing protein [Bacteroidota bacterium]